MVDLFILFALSLEFGEEFASAVRCDVEFLPEVEDLAVELAETVCVLG